ncbi:hypothetical protein J5N97_005964 [Dioscorea zingiberensis]|uniref:Disease resistance N-terminal domain-containing protein n=1 Tax=Dioscorea zingiberensis TaxID=325984 RepID=A0A9D5DB48_9LILI|nr:hypothetical protein J5N97_005964 [Dioscorea zingiberensis]
MASSSGLSRGFLSPTEIALTNTASHLLRLRRYLYHEKSSDSSEADKAVQSLEGKLWMLRRLIRSSNELPDERVTSLLSELREVLYEVEDLADELEYLELPRKAKETNMPEAARSLSRGRKRLQDDVMIEQIRQITNQLNRIDTHLFDAMLKMQEEDFNGGKQQPIIGNEENGYLFLALLDADCLGTAKDSSVALPHHGFTGSSHWSLVLASIYQDSALPLLL